MTTVAFIPARGGSKGLPNKNIRNIHGKPLIAWSILSALESTRIQKVFVSTDSSEIAKCALSYGAEVPFLRPASISGDDASTESAMLHFCEWLNKNKQEFDNLLLIQPTSPIRAVGRFDSAIKYFEDNAFDSLVAVAETHRFRWRNLDEPTASYDFMKRPRRQDISETMQEYIETGSFYLTKLKKFISSGNRITGKIGLYVTPEDESYEIDSLTDFKICECLLAAQNKD